MDQSKMLEAMQYLDPQLIQEASAPIIRKKTRLRAAVLAACLILLIALPVVAVTGNLLVEHYYGKAIPDQLKEQELDAFFRVNTADKISITELSQNALDAAAAQKDNVGYYDFETWAEAEAFLGLNILDSDLIQSGHSIPLTDAEGNLVQDSPCHMTLLRGDDGLLYSIHLAYYFKDMEDMLFSLNANAVTDQNPNDNNSSIGVSNDSAFVLQQTAEAYQSASGRHTTIISTEYSDGHGWDISGWIHQNGFVIRLSISADDAERGQQSIRNLLDSIQ